MLRSIGPFRALHTSSNVRNVAIVAHVDHGKTSLVDCLLKQLHHKSDTNAARLMDYNQLERERGITILAKCTSLDHQGYRINIVDTPGHADFGGEVERALALVDGIVLVVDATEGPMVQTRAILSMALARGLRPIVVFNKLDRATHRCDEVDTEVFDLFTTLNATDEQLSYPTIFASAKEGWATADRGLGTRRDMHDLVQTIISHVPPPVIGEGPFAMLVNALDQSPFLGQSFLGKVASGMVRVGDTVKVLGGDGVIEEAARVNQLFIRRGAVAEEIQEGHAGDILTLNGPSKAAINTTICARDRTTPLEPFSVNPPTVSIMFYLNDSPLKGTEGKSLTSRLLHDRISTEASGNLSLQVKTTSRADCFEVLGRGEMQLGVLAENIRREGYELAIGRPKVLFKTTPEGGVLEPMAELTVDCPTEFMGVVIEGLSRRRAELLRTLDYGEEGKTRIIFDAPIRGLIGYSAEFKNVTHGGGVMTYAFTGYSPHHGAIDGTGRKGSLISMASGQATRHALAELEPRGTLFIKPGDLVYEGMVVGESSRAMDMHVNPCRMKETSNFRTVLKDDSTRLKPFRSLTLEDMIAYMSDDELIEITPKAIRLRKREDARSKKLSQR